ncbi:MAG: discoidin domain-containing protein [Myxococcota bacterium]
MTTQHAQVVEMDGRSEVEPGAAVSVTGAPPPRGKPPVRPVPPPPAGDGALVRFLRRLYLFHDELTPPRRPAFGPDAPGWQEYRAAKDAWNAATQLGAQGPATTSTRRMQELALLRDAVLWALRARLQHAAQPLPAIWAVPTVFSLLERMPQVQRGMREQGAAALRLARGAFDVVEQGNDAALGSRQAAEQALALHGLVGVLLDPLEAASLRPRLVRLRRAWRFLLTAALLASPSLALLTRGPAPGTNLALNRPVTTSKLNPDPGFPDPRKVVDGDRSIMGFCTANADLNWVTVDLGEVFTIHEVHVYNRTDCCSERAVPLALQVSEDGKTFETLGKVTATFQVWKPRFEPHSARYVRLSHQGKNWLHLNEIEVY